MSTAKRRINSTGRKRITREHIDVRMLSTGPGEALKATMSLSLDDLGLPPSAAVVVEGYHGSSGMRFDCGTVGAIRIPEVVHLTDIDRGGSVLFRLKVVDSEAEQGKILASAERLRPRSDDEEKDRRSLFPVRHRDLGPEIWKLEINDAGPVLLLNNRVPGFTHRILENPLLQGTLLPAAFRGVLEFLAEDTGEDEEDEETWKSDWLRYCSEQLDISDDPSDVDADARAEWIDDAVRRFCGKYGFVDKIRAMIVGEHYNA